MDATVTLTGYVGNVIEVKKTKTGVSSAEVRVGTTPRMKRGNEWISGATTWTTVMCYRTLADNVAASVLKGDPVVVEGRIRTHVWVNDEHEARDKTLVEAVTLGHDLTKGTAMFTKRTRRIAEDPALAAIDATMINEDEEAEEAEAQSFASESGDDMDVPERKLALVA